MHRATMDKVASRDDLIGFNVLVFLLQVASMGMFWSFEGKAKYTLP
jgi:hypothetical protein